MYRLSGTNQERELLPEDYKQFSLAAVDASRAYVWFAEDEEVSMSIATEKV
jgi:hypothetical protein